MNTEADDDCGSDHGDIAAVYQRYERDRGCECGPQMIWLHHVVDADTATIQGHYATIDHAPTCRLHLAGLAGSN